MGGVKEGSSTTDTPDAPPLSTIQECKDMLGVGCAGPDGWAPSPNPDSPGDLEQTSLFSQTLPFPTCTMGPWHPGVPCDIP